jgi:cytochrome c553
MKSKVLVLIAALAIVFIGVSVHAAKAKKTDKKVPETEAAAFVGSASCQACHPLEFDSRAKSLAVKMVLTKEEGLLKGAFEKWESDGKNPGPAKGNITGRAVKLDDVEYVIGTRWKQRYMVKNEVDGGHQFLNKQYNTISGQWENYGNKNDWATTCATCHTTGFKVLNYDPANPKATKVSYTERGIGCEACHGPGSKHIQSKSAKDIWNPAKQPKDAQTAACGYCHIRLENDKFKTLQGNNSEHFPAPKVGESFKPGDDWRAWYPEGVVIPGVQSNQPFSKAYTQADFKGMFLVDDISKANGVYEEGKHHQQYQGFIQSKHYQKSILSCNDCHASHAVKGKQEIQAKDTCVRCHGDRYPVDTVMPGTGKTAENLYVRTHTFLKNQSRPSGKTVPSGYYPEIYKK